VLLIDCESALPSGYSQEPYSLATEENFTSYHEAPKSLVGLEAENKEIVPSAPKVFIDYTVKYRVFLDGDVECDTIWPNLSGLDRFTSIISGPTPSYLVMSQGDTSTVQYVLNSTRYGEKTIWFEVSSTCYRSTWKDGVYTTYTVVPNMGSGKRQEPEPVTGFEITRLDHRPDAVLVHFIAHEPMSVRLGVYDLRGRRVYSVQQSAVSGSNILEWGCRDGSGERVASGVYLLRLQGSDKSFVRRVSVIH
jgi:hypothetical protein